MTEPYTVVAMNIRDDFTNRAEKLSDPGTSGLRNIFKDTVHKKFSKFIHEYPPTKATYCFGYTVESNTVYHIVMEARQIYSPATQETSWMTRPEVDNVTAKMVLDKAKQLKMVEDADGSDEIMQYISELTLPDF